MTQESKRKRSPWFAFYPDDFIAGTRCMSPLARAVYVDLLCIQFASGYAPASAKAIQRLCGIDADEWEAISDEVLAKFDEIEPGKLVNSRMDAERIEREGIRQSRIEAAKSRWEQKHKQNGCKTDASAYPSAYASTSTSTSNNKSEREKEKIRPSLEDARSVAGQIGVTPEEAETWWMKREATDWMRSAGGKALTPVGANWRADCKQWVIGERERNVSTPRNGSSKPNGKREAWMVQKEIDGICTQIRRLNDEHRPSGWGDVPAKISRQIKALGKRRDELTEELANLT